MIEARETGSGLTGLEEDASASVRHDALLHLETLLVVTAGDSENVTLVGVVVHDFASDFLAHLLVVEGTTKSSR